MKSVNNVDDLKNEGGEWVMSYNPEKNVKHVTVSGKLWLGINDRCKHGGKKHILQPSYVGCENHFESFQEFAEWCQTQVGYNTFDEKLRRFHLDKDLLVRGNKIYSPDTCLFLPVELNSLLVKANKIRGACPIGVSARRGKFFAQCQAGNATNVHLGTYATVDEAFCAYKNFKESFIKQQAEKYKDVIDPRAYNALMHYKVLITD